MGSTKKSSDRDRERDKEVRKKRKDRSKERARQRSRSRDRDRERSRSRDRRRDRSKSKERRRDRSKSKERGRERSRSRERGRERSRSRERGRDRSKSKERGRERSRSRERGRDRSKSKERGRERSRSRERRRERSRSREKERRKISRKDQDRDRSHDREVSKWERSPDSINGERHGGLSEVEELEGRGHGKKGSDTPPPKEKEETVDTEVKGPSASGDVTSLSIEETNKLRIFLGMKPLKVEGEISEEEKKTEVKKEPIHAPPKNMGEIKASEMFVEKLATRKESRRIAKALSSVKTLGEANKEREDIDEDTKAWVSKMRRNEEERKKAEKKAQMLAEMDEEFGIGDIISEVEMEDKKKAYMPNDLRGIKVEHDVGAFKEGRDLTLVIKDAGVLDDTDDVLLNVNVVEDEKAAKNVELKKGKPGYNPYEEEQVDEFGNLKKKDILDKYNEEIHGVKKKVFTLGEDGAVNTSSDREREIIRQRLLDKSISLEVAPARIASEYYTNEEMVQFKKPKKRKLRKKEKFKVDDLLPLSNDRKDSKDHGSRSQHHAEEDMEIETSVPASATDDLKDEADSSVTQALMRTRRLLKRPKTDAESTGAAKVVTMLQQNVDMNKKAEREEDKDVIFLDTTAEFCKQVGEDEQRGPHRLSSSYHGDDDIHEDDLQDFKDDAMDIEEEGGWMEVRENTEKKKAPQATDLYQEAEPLVASGVAAALQLAAKKGFMADDTSSKKTEVTTTVIQPTIGRRDIEYERQKEKERDRELSRFGRESSFVEKKGYTPDVHIEYVDDHGRLLNTKEAFRYMSHKFHGRGSGRKKTEKRMKKFQDEHLLNSSSSVDTPLNTLSVLQSKQKAAQSPYILVSGGAQSLLAPDIAKRK